MLAAKMDRKITVEQREVTGKSPSGEDIFGWTLVLSRSAEFIPNRGQEKFSANQKQSESDALFRIRRYPSDPSVRPEMRLLCDSEVYDITSVVPMRGRFTGLEISVTAGLTNG